MPALSGDMLHFYQHFCQKLVNSLSLSTHKAYKIKSPARKQENIRQIINLLRELLHYNQARVADTNHKYSLLASQLKTYIQAAYALVETDFKSYRESNTQWQMQILEGVRDPHGQKTLAEYH